MQEIEVECCLMIGRCGHEETFIQLHIVIELIISGNCGGESQGEVGNMGILAQLLGMGEMAVTVYCMFLY